MTAERSESPRNATSDGHPEAAAKRDAAVLLLAKGCSSDKTGEQLGVTGGTVRTWLSRYPEMRAQISDVRRSMFEAATGRAAEEAADMVDVLVDLAASDKVEPQHRIRAALGVLDQAVKLRGHTDLEAEFQKLREAVEGMVGGGAL